MAEQQEQQGFATPPEQAVPAPVVQSTTSATPTKLSATDINTKISTGTPLASNEALPDVPQGMSAKGFYGQFPGGASVYSQAPFKQATYTPEAAAQQSNENAYNFEATTPLVADGTTTSTFVSQEDQGSDTGDEGSSASFDTQMNDIMSSTNAPIDLGYSFEFDPNLSIIDDLSKNFDEFGVSLLKDTGIDLSSFGNTLKNVGSRLGTAATTTLEDFTKETNAVLKELEEYQLSDIAPDALNYVVDSFNELKTNLTNLANPDKVAEATGYFATQFTKTIASNLINKVIGGAFGGPIGMAVISLASNVDWEKGQIGRHFDDSSSDEPNTIAGYNPNGVAVNSQGNPGMIDGTYSFSSIGGWFSNFGKTISEIENEASVITPTPTPAPAPTPALKATKATEELIRLYPVDTSSDNDYSGSYEDSADADGTGDIGSGVSAPSEGSYPDTEDDSGMSSGSDSGGDGGDTDGGGNDDGGNDDDEGGGGGMDY